MSAGHGNMHRVKWLLVVTMAAALSLAQSPATKFNQKKGSFKNPAAEAQLTTVPNLLGLNLSHASQAVADARLILNVTSGNQAQGESLIVVSQDPPADPNRRVLVESKVNVVLAKVGVALKLERSPTQVGVPLTVTATLSPDVATTAYYYFEWGDGSQPDVRQRSGVHSHTYFAPGTYPITVQVLFGDTPLSAKTNVRVESPYSITLEPSNTRLEANFTDTFVAKLDREPPANSTVTYCFEWKDGSEPQCAQLQSDRYATDHIFREAGTYDVTVTATLDTGSVLSQPARVEVLAPPQVNLIPETPFPMLGRQTGFTLNINGELPSDVALQYCFVWQEGGVAECGKSLHVFHSYAAPGIYDVSAYVKAGEVSVSANSVPLKVYEVSLNPVPAKSATEEPIKFRASVVPDSLTSMMEYCFDLGDGTRSCVGHPSLDYPYSSRGTYRASVEVKLGNRTVATSASVPVEIGWPVWLVAVLWGAGFAALSGVGYGIKKLRKPRREEARGQSPVAVRVVPKLDERPQYRMTAPKSPPKCLVRIRWVQGAAQARVNPQGTLVKKKGGAHA